MYRESKGILKKKLHRPWDTGKCTKRQLVETHNKTMIRTMADRPSTISGPI